MIKIKQENFSVGSFIFARGGSQGIKKKNITKLNGKPLIQYSIEAAQKNEYIDDVYVSTDDLEIAEVALKLGANVPFIRPKELADNDTPELLAWKHALNFLKANNKLPDIFISLPTTSPLRANGDITNSLEALVNSKADICISICASDRNPYFNMVQVYKNGIAELLLKSKKAINRRQDAPEIYDITTVAYTGWSKYLLETEEILNGIVTTTQVPKERSIDIDTPFDLKLAEFLIKQDKAY